MVKKKELEEIEMRSCGPIAKLPCSSYAKDHLVRMYGEHCVEVGHFYCSYIYGDVVPTRYIWSIGNVASYPTYKDVKLENSVEAFLGSIGGGASALELAKQREDKKSLIDEIVSFDGMVSNEQVINSILGRGTLTPLDYPHLAEIMYGEIGKAPSLGAAALATLRSGDHFLKISQGSNEHENLVRIRMQLGLNNEATLYDCSGNTFLVIPASYYDPHRNLTLTISHFAGENSYDVLYNTLLKPIFLEVGEKKGIELGAAIARLHTRLGVPHNDIHPGNVRFTESIDKPGEAEKFFFIDVECIDKKYKDENKIIVDVLSLLVVTICHRFQNYRSSDSNGLVDSLLGSKQVTETEKFFASGLIKGYFDAATPEMRLTIYKQFLEYKQKNGQIRTFYGIDFFSALCNDPVFNDLKLDQIFEQEKANHSLVEVVSYRKNEDTDLVEELLSQKESTPIKKIKYFLDI